MGLRFDALKKFFMSDRMIDRSVGRKVKKNQRDESKLIKDLKKIAEAGDMGLTDVLVDAFKKYEKDSEKELGILDDALNSLFIVKKRNIERLQASIVKQKDPKAKQRLEKDLSEIKKQLNTWFTILQGNAKGGRLQLARMGESTLAQEIISISRVHSRKLGKLKREEKRAGSDSSDKNLNRLESDLHDTEGLEDKELSDLENLTLIEEQMQMTEIGQILKKLKEEGYPEKDYRTLEESRVQLDLALRNIFNNQIKTLNTLIRIS